MAFAVVNTVLYSLSLPLWEGFDEAFHYAYIESLSVDRQIPVLGRTPVSQEIRTSLELTPLSFILARNIPGTLSFENWFALSQDERVQRAKQLRNIPAAELGSPSSLLNYEAQQAPLAYMVLAPIDVISSGIDLPSRILLLRFVCSISATILIFAAFRWLCRTLDLDAPFRLAALALFFEMQIYEASIAHVANDWLSITAAIWFFATVGALVRFNRRRDAVLLAIVLATGLLAKAYFLAFVAVFLAVLAAKVLRREMTFNTALISVAISAAIAGPWYLRNLFVYRTLAGMQENFKGVSKRDALYAFTQIHWSRTLIESARRGLWTGNESYLSFSQSTLNLLLLLLLAGFVLFLLRARQIRAPERWVLATASVFVLALMYDLCVAWVDTHGLQTNTGPYYIPCILPAMFGLTFLGLQRSGKPGRIIAVAISLVALWIGLLTYLAKLLPYYGGLIGRSTFGVILRWWTSSDSRKIFAVTTLGPSKAIYTVLFLYAALLLWVTWQVSTSLLHTPNPHK